MGVTQQLSTRAACLQSPSPKLETSWACSLGVLQSPAVTKWVQDSPVNRAKRHLKEFCATVTFSPPGSPKGNTLWLQIKGSQCFYDQNTL